MNNYALQKKAIRIITFCPPRTPPKPLFSKHNYSLHFISKFHVGCLVFSHFNRLLPIPVSSILILSRVDHHAGKLIESVVYCSKILHVVFADLRPFKPTSLVVLMYFSECVICDKVKLS